MTHHHHDHGHSHDHSHDHGHDHSHEEPAQMSFQEKMEKLLDHWLKHNTDHAESYTDWAQKAQDQEMPGVAQLLKEVSDMTLSINKKFEEAAALIRKP